jgi:dephospho-CoA kinase
MVVIGLTGSLGMGKSTTARFFAEAGVPVHDADGTVHRLYAGEAAHLIEQAFPGTTTAAGVDRTRLAQRVLGDAEALRRLEGIVHPLVRREELRFLDEAEKAGVPVVVLDIPLLFETGGDSRVDAVVVVSAPAEMQRARAFERPGMTEEKFRALLAKQMPDAEKRRRADFVVDTSNSLDSARAQVHAILRDAPQLPIRRGRGRDATVRDADGMGT